MDESLQGETRQRRDPALRVWLIVAVGAAAVLAYLVATSDDPIANRGPASPAVGVELSVLQFAPLTEDAAPVRREDLRDKVTLINYWGPWCYFCRQEIPHLLALDEKLKGRDDFRLLLVSNAYDPYADIDDLRRETAEYMEQLDAAPPTFHDPHSQSLGGLAREAKLKNIGFPITVLLDQNCVVRGLWQGFREEDAEQMERLVEEFLE